MRNDDPCPSATCRFVPTAAGEFEPFGYGRYCLNRFRDEGMRKTTAEAFGDRDVPRALCPDRGRAMEWHLQDARSRFSTVARKAPSESLRVLTSRRPGIVG